MSGELESKSAKLLLNGICPDCKSNNFYKGPSGPGAQNVECAGCGSRFNISMFDARRIDHRDDDKKREVEEAKLKPITIDNIHKEVIEYRSKLSFGTIGIHQLCNGYIKVIRVSKDWNALTCRCCNLRKLFPAHIDLNAFDMEMFWERLTYYFENN